MRFPMTKTARQTPAGHTSSAIVAGLLLFLLSNQPATAQDAVTSDHSKRPWTVPSDDEIRQLLAQRMRVNGVGIVVGVIEPAGRRIVTYGESGAADGRPLDGDTVFQIGSVTKVFTTLLLADMVQRGEVKLDDPASKYLPAGVKMPERGRPITLLDMATHRSGLPSMPTNFELTADPDPYEAYSAKQLYEFLSTYSLNREPGVQAEYSNLAVSLLGRLLARRAGIEYEALLKARLVEPLGMHSTSIKLTPDQSRRLAPGHDRYLDPVRTWELAALPASGSIRSTANDMLKFLAANLGYLDTPLKASMELQRAVRQPANGSQALGWSVRKSAGDETFGHAGGKEGYRSGVGFDPKNRTGVVVLANARTDDAPVNIALYLLVGRPLTTAPSAPPKRKQFAIDDATLDAYSGLYQLEPDRILAVARKDTHLLVDIRGDGILTFFAQGTKDFFSNTTDDEISFQVDERGRISGLILRQDGQAKSALRM